MKKLIDILIRLFFFSVACFFGFIMFYTSDVTNYPLFSQVFGFLCFSVALSLVTSGKTRDFFFSVIGLAFILGSIWYLYSTITGGQSLISKRSEPSVLNAIFFALFFGLPSFYLIRYLKFGFHNHGAENLTTLIENYEPERVFIKTKQGIGFHKEEKDSFKSKITKEVISFFDANPGYTPRMKDVDYWLIELLDGDPWREIALDKYGEHLFSGPDENNYGFWLDTNMILSDFYDKEFITEESFETVWETTKNYRVGDDDFWS